MRNYRRANRKRAYYDSMSDSRTPMSQSELAAEAEAVFDIVFDEDPNALSQSGAIGKIFDHFKRYGISNDYSDAVDMIIYIEENLLKHSHRANRRVANADHAEAVDFVFSSFDKDIKEFGWWYIYDYGKLYADVEKILSRGFIGGPFDIDKIIDDVINGRSRFFIPRVSRRASHKRAYYDDYLESGGAFNYENPNYEYYTDREIEEGLRPQEFDGWSNRETQLAIGATGDINVYLAVDNLAWNGTPNDIAQYYQNNIDHSGYDLNLVNWEEIWEAMRDQ